jgi:hypothetical protein
MARDVENPDDAPYQTPSSSIRGIDPGYDLHVRLDVVVGQLDREREAAEQRCHGGDLRNHIDKLQKAICALRNIMMDAPSAVQAAAIGIDIGRAVQQLGLWDDIDAVVQAQYRKARQRECREQLKEIKKGKVRAIFARLSEETPSRKRTAIYREIAEELSIPERTVRSYVRG